PTAPRSPRSRLFPYTTLFRSGIGGAGGRVHPVLSAVALVGHLVVEAVTVVHDVVHHQLLAVRVELDLGQRVAARVAEDDLGPDAAVVLLEVGAVDGVAEPAGAVLGVRGVVLDDPRVRAVGLGRGGGEDRGGDGGGGHGGEGRDGTMAHDHPSIASTVRSR